MSEEEPSAKKEPSARKEPSAYTEPLADKEPSAGKEPSADGKPSATLEQRRLALLERLIQGRAAELAKSSFTQSHWRNALQRAERLRPAAAQRLLDKAETVIAALEAADSAHAANRNDASEEGTGGAALRTQTRERLAQLNSLLAQVEPLLPDNSPAAVLHTALAEQDRRFWAAMGQGHSEPAVPTWKQGLQAARDLSATRARFQLDQLLATAVAHQPEFPGPLNPQRLLVRLLTRLHEISPAYLIRTLDHSRTLFGQPGRKEASSPSKGVRKKG